MVMSVYPMIAALIGGGLMFFYKLDHEMMVEIETELVRRRNEE
jgi:Na+/melibiose symporter-like transporter